jgi:UDP-glucuronate 4-epimerase
MPQTILVTGAAGFIGYHVAAALLDRGETVIGYDNLNDYYAPQLKRSRLDLLLPQPNFHFHAADICDFPRLEAIFQAQPIDRICHLAAQVGVRYSLKNPFAYQKSNLEGFQNVMELARQYQVKNFVYASSSSVYGGNTTLPFSEDQDVSKPISLYAATKRANELMAHSYAHLYGLPCTGLRFFTVYGPSGRPDMAPILFCQAIFQELPIKVFNHGRMKRDFTYISDIVDGVLAALERPVAYDIINLARGETVLLTDFISGLEEAIGIAAIRQYEDIQPGDVRDTFGDIRWARHRLGYDPKVSVTEGIARLVAWYKEYYNL